MMLRRANSLRRKILVVTLATTLVAVVFSLGAIIVYDVRLFQRNWIADMKTQAELLGRSSVPALLFDDAKVANENLGLLRYRKQIRSAAIYDSRGALFSSFVAEGYTERFPELPGPDGTRIDGRDLVVFQRILSDGQIMGTVYLRADFQIIERVVSYVIIALVVALQAMIVAYLLSTRLQRIVTQPVFEIVSVAKEVVKDGDYSLRARKLSDDEVGALTDSFNSMLSEIETRTDALEISNERLAREVAERAEAESEVLRLNSELEERVRVRTSQLEVAVRELETFSYSVSHDLRAPLRGIHGFSQSLVEDFPESLPPSAHHALSRITASAARMEQLIEDLLNLSRLSRGELARRDVDLSELARQVVANLQNSAPDRAIEVSVWNGMSANGDPRLLLAVLENLIGNAWKFTSKTERARIEIGSLRDGGRRIFFVRDNGAGFDMAYADKLFGPFQRLHRDEEFPGTGIGLATVARIVIRHGGRVWAEAEEGSGAVFYFTLQPENEMTAAEAEPQSQEQAE